MNNLLQVNNSERFPISGRELHKRLGIKTSYTMWFDRMVEYGFEEGRDFNSLKKVSVQIEGKREVTRGIFDHNMTLDMAKHLCMIQRTPKGMEVWQYLIDVENKWNTPDAVIARALKMVWDKVNALQGEIRLLTTTNETLKRKATYCDLILSCSNAVPVSVIAKDYGKSAVQLNGWLRALNIQYRQGGIWLLYADYADRGYTCIKTFNYTREDGSSYAKGHTYWTQKGRRFIYGRLKEHGILPTMEGGLNNA